MEIIRKHFSWFSLRIAGNLMGDVLSNTPIKTSNRSYTTLIKLNCRFFGINIAVITRSLTSLELLEGMLWTKNWRCNEPKQMVKNDLARSQCGCAPPQTLNVFDISSILSLFRLCFSATTGRWMPAFQLCRAPTFDNKFYFLIWFKITSFDTHEIVWRGALVWLIYQAVSVGFFVVVLVLLQNTHARARCTVFGTYRVRRTHVRSY